MSLASDLNIIAHANYSGQKILDYLISCMNKRANDGKFDLVIHTGNYDNFDDLEFAIDYLKGENLDIDYDKQALKLTISWGSWGTY